jgi:hypothetical protein
VPERSAVPTHGTQGYVVHPIGARYQRWSTLKATVNDGEGGQQSHNRASSSKYGRRHERLYYVSYTKKQLYDACYSNTTIKVAGAELR